MAQTDSEPTLFSLRLPPPKLTRYLAGASALGVIFLIWWMATRGADAESRLVSPVILPSPVEVIASFPSLWYEPLYLGTKT